MNQQATIALTMIFKPLCLLIVLAAVYPIRLLVERTMRDGKLKRLLLRRVND